MQTTRVWKWIKDVRRCAWISAITPLFLKPCSDPTCAWRASQWGQAGVTHDRVLPPRLTEASGSILGPGHCREGPTGQPSPQVRVIFRTAPCKEPHQELVHVPLFSEPPYRRPHPVPPGALGEGAPHHADAFSFFFLAFSTGGRAILKAVSQVVQMGLKLQNMDKHTEHT